jgi:Malectin domain
VFNVLVEGALAIDNLDIVKAAGGAFAAYVVPAQTTVSDGFATIELVAVVENPMITAIEIIKLPAPTPVAPPVAPPVAAPILAPVTVPTNAPPTPTTSALTANAIARINAGGGQFVDAAGNTWIADNYFGGKGASYASCPAIVANTADDELYCTNRWFAPKSDTPPFVYQIPVSVPGQYEVRLHFSELVSLLFAFELPMAVVV